MTLDGDGLSFSNKTTSYKERNVIGAADFGVKLQLPTTDHHQSVPFNTMMVFHHPNQDRPLIPSKGMSSDHGGVNFGPTSCDRNKSMMINYSSDIYYPSVAVGHGDSSSTGGGICGGLVGLRTLQQPFDISETTSTSAFKSPGGMAATLGFPFTNAQWKELERQAMIFKYMMASIPVPPQLLCPAAASHSTLSGGLNLRFTNGTDLEPGRCRRTDGKKWRCSRDAAPDQKYCERHMHRGKPRSRKPVELNANTNNKKTRPNPAIFTESPVTAAISYNNNSSSNNGCAASQFGGTTPQSSLQTPVFLEKSCNKVANFDANVTFVSAYEEPRNLDWNMMKEPDRQWQHLVPTEIGLATESSFNNGSVLNQRYQEQSLNLNSFGNFGGGGDQESNECAVFLDETPGGFIDAWSSGGASDGHNTSSRNTSSVSSNGKLCLSPLSLSMGVNKSMDDEMGQIKMGLGLIESDQKHDTSTPGGPLAEVLQLSTGTNGTGTINRSSSVVENGESSSTTPATTVSSPSGVLQKTFASFSDSSGNTSPTLASSRARPTQIDLLWLNQC